MQEWIAMKTDGLILDRLEVFVATAKTRNFSAAARRLSISQAAVSRSIASLEKRLGLRLFERTTRQVVLTNEGAKFHARISPLLEHLQDAVTKTLDDKGAARGMLRVTVDTVFLSVISPITLGLFVAENPELTLDLITKDRRSDLRSESVDLDIRFGAVPRGSFIRRKLGETRVLTVAAPRYIERFGRLRSPTDMLAKNHVIIDFCDPITARPFEWTFRNKRKEEVTIPTDGRIIVNDIANMHGLCLAGFGIAQVLEVAVRDQLRDGRLIALFPDWQEEVFPLIAIYPSRQHTPLKTKTFLNFVVNEVKKTLW
jgi:DNA-binding transcriptional LysR family regulator